MSSESIQALVGTVNFLLKLLEMLHESLKETKDKIKKLEKELEQAKSDKSMSSEELEEKKEQLKELKKKYNTQRARVEELRDRIPDVVRTMRERLDHDADFQAALTGRNVRTIDQMIEQEVIRRLGIKAEELDANPGVKGLIADAKRRALVEGENPLYRLVQPQRPGAGAVPGAAPAPAPGEPI